MPPLKRMFEAKVDEMIKRRNNAEEVKPDRNMKEEMTKNRKGTTA